MNVSAQFSDYWTNVHLYQNYRNQFFSECEGAEKTPEHYAHNGYHPGAAYQNVKEEPTYESCRFSINQTYSNNFDNSITPSVNHDFTQHLNQFDSCQQGLYDQSKGVSTNETSLLLNENKLEKKDDDSPALRALLTRPQAKNNNYQSMDFQNFNEDTPCEEERYGSPPTENKSVAENASFYPWMKSNGRIL